MTGRNPVRDERRDLTDDIDAVADCDCAPTPRERRALWPSRMSRRGALVLGAAGAAGVVVAGVAVAPHLPAANALAFRGPVKADYPSWNDVIQAKANQAAKAAEVSRVQSAIAQLQAAVTSTQQAADQAGAEFYQAQQDYFSAVQRANDLQSQADAKLAQAKDAASRAGKVAAQLYSDGGDTQLQLFLSSSATSADDLLAKLGTMDTVLAANNQVYASALSARNLAQSLSDQAKVARDERDRLQKIAEQKMAAAQSAAAAAQTALDNQTANLDTLQAQLAALASTTTQTIAQYQAGVIAAQKARAEAEARARAQALADAAKNTGGSDAGGGGNGSTGAGGRVNGNGWCRPSSGYESSGYGPRTPICLPHQACTSNFHHGVDFANSCGSAIYAAAAGRVVYAGPYGGLGNYIHLDHGGNTGTGYAHIRDGGIYVGVGQTVQAGQLIAAEGSTGQSTGCHLHFETYVNGTWTNPVGFMSARGVSV
jgi:murein DD-endopeptidase MepM/ murein hydrolase activator NlpD